MHLLLEGRLEEFVADKLLTYCGHTKGIVYGRRGVTYIRERAACFHHLALGGTGVLVLTDFRDAEAPCPKKALYEYLLRIHPSPSPHFLCRFAVFELEGWLLADRKSLAAFLKISPAAVPLAPDTEKYPKNCLIGLARRSRSSQIRDGLVPEKGHYSKTAPLYLATMAEFVVNHWNIEAAAQNSPSLSRCVERLCRLRQTE